MTSEGKKLTTHVAKVIRDLQSIELTKNILVQVFS